MMNLPQNWKIKTIEEVCEITMGQSPKGDEVFSLTDENQPKKKALEFHQGKIHFSNKFIQESKFITTDIRKKAPKDSILLCVRAPVGVVNLTQREIAIGRGLCAIKGKDIDTLYLFYFLQTQKSYFENLATGSTFSAITLSIVKDTPIPLPPLEIQREIVEILESKLEKIASAKAILESSLKECETYRLSLLNDAFNGNLTPHSKDWQWVTLKDIGTIITGSTPSKANQEFYGDDYPLFKPTDLESGYYTQDSRDKVSLLGFQQGREIPPKSTLVTCIGATIGKTGFTRTKGICNQQINAIIPDKKQVIEEFVYFYCISPLFQSQILSSYHSTTLPILKKSLFEKLSIPLPPLEIQREIVEILESKLEKIASAKSLLESSLKKCETYRLSLLESAFEGKLV